MNSLSPQVARWRKSSYSGPTGGECVELAVLPAGVLVRDSKNPDAAHLTFGCAVFGGLVRGMRAGRHRP
ncbi:DUF397 domain-containing protein [Actinocorallia populi]|uniref:DUF397 domain-containing protein n=1 Tax=Actinocorallia populi TaxID=2079200 RepID=UPI000D091EC6|nr:DUF397 domain-containing protein [Actinocorallia populi]